MSPAPAPSGVSLPPTPSLVPGAANPYANQPPTAPATPAAAAAAGAASPAPGGVLAPPSLPGSNSTASISLQLSRLELAALQLSRQYELMMHSMQDSEKHLANMTLHHVASLHQACKSSSSSVGILLDTHTALIRKTAIAVQQTEGIDALEKHIAMTRSALTELEKGVEALCTEDALHATRQQLQAELAAAGGSSSSGGTGGNGAGRINMSAAAPPQPAGLILSDEDEDDDDALGLDQPAGGVAGSPPQSVALRNLHSGRSHGQGSNALLSARSHAAGAGGGPGTPLRHHTPSPDHTHLDAL